MYLWVKGLLFHFWPDVAQLTAWATYQLGQLISGNFRAENLKEGLVCDIDFPNIFSLKNDKGKDSAFHTVRLCTYDWLGDVVIFANC